MATISNVVYQQAKTQIGTWEWAGHDHNPAVLKYYVDAGHPEIRNDEVPWCAAFVGSMLARVGLPNTGSLLARSYLKWGEEVAVSQAEKGDIVVIPRGNSTWQGHVGFFDRLEGGRVYILGGNQGDQVNIRDYPADIILGIRRAKRQRTSATQSKAVRTSAGGIATAAGGAATAVGALEGNAQIIALCFAGVMALFFMYLMRDRLKKWAEGIR